MRLKTLLPWLSLMALLVAFDQATKAYISVNRELFDSREVIPGFFYLTYLENRGAAFSMLQGFRWGLVIITIIALAVLIKYFIQFKDALARLSLSFLIAGAIGNFIDRVHQGFVVDFFHFLPFGFNFPVFNIADICVTVGTALLAVWLLFIYKEPKVPEGDNT